MEARPGRRCSTSTTRPARSIWSSTADSPTRSTRRCTTCSAGRGSCSKTASPAGSTRPPTAGRRGRSLPAACRRRAQGRIGLDIYQKNPNILYAVTENFGKRPPTEDEANRDRTRKIEPQPRNIGGEVYRTDDGGKTWRKVNPGTGDMSAKAGYSFNQIRVDPNNDQRIIINSDSLLSSDDGGKTWTGLNWNSRNLFAQRIRRLPLDVDRPAELRPLDSRERRRCPDLLRRREDVRPLRQYPGRRVLLDCRRHGGSVSDLRRPPGSRLVARADQRTGGSRGPRGLGDGGRQRRDVQPRGPDRQPVGLQHHPVGRALPLRPEDPHAQVDRADAAGRPAAAQVELDAAARALAVQQPHHLHGRSSAPPVARPGRPLGGDQS